MKHLFERRAVLVSLLCLARQARMSRYSTFGESRRFLPRFDASPASRHFSFQDVSRESRICLERLLSSPHFTSRQPVSFHQFSLPQSMSSIVGKGFSKMQDALTRMVYGKEAPTAKALFYELTDKAMDGKMKHAELSERLPLQRAFRCSFR